MKKFRFIAAAAAASMLLIGVGSASSAPKLKQGYYDCYGYDYYSGFLMYKGSIKLKSKKRYEHSFGRDGKKMTDKTTGKYRVRGARIKFKGGAMSKTPGRIKKSDGDRHAHIEVWVNGGPSGISCYYDPKP